MAVISGEKRPPRDVAPISPNGLVLPIVPLAPYSHKRLAFADSSHLFSISAMLS